MNNVELAYYYVMNVAKEKKYNLQSIAINKFTTRVDKKKFIRDLNSNLKTFNNLYMPYISRDIIFKNNSLVTRNSVLISPAHYFYFTKLVLDLVIDTCENNKLHYKTEFIHAYYSGVLFNSINVIENPKQILFNNAYNRFQEELLKNEGKQALKIDLSNFFDSINVSDLIALLYTKYKRSKVEKLEEFFKCLEVLTLPQFHYSIASSILSQEYLANFDSNVTSLLRVNKLQMIRFVDDMFLFNNGEQLIESEFHIILDKINNILWKNKLNLNSKKIELFIDEHFKRELSGNVYSRDDYRFKTEKIIDNKAKGLINNEFMNFIKKVNSLYFNKGYNIEEFSNMFEDTFSVDKGNSRKVLNNFTFGHKWKALNLNDLDYIISNYQFVFYLPDIFLTLYLMIYEFIEIRHGRNEVTIRKLLNEIDSNNDDSLRYLYSSLNYLIQRNFKKNSFINKISHTEEGLGEYIKKYITD